VNFWLTHTRDPASPSHFLSSKEDAQMSSPPPLSLLYYPIWIE
jgi:hypothetical protein